MKKTGIALIVAGALIVCGIALTVIGLLLGVNRDMSVTKTEKTPVSIEIAEDFDELQIDGASDDILVAVSEDGKCRVESWESKKQKLVAEVLNRTLYVEHEDQRSWIDMLFGSSGPSGYKTVVYLPKTEYEKIHVSMTSGDIRISGELTVKLLYVHATNSDIGISGVSSEKMDISVTSGSILIGDCESGQIDVHTTSGEIGLSDITCETVKTDTTSGETKLTRVSAAASVDLKATSGDISLSDVSCEKLKTDTTSGEVNLKRVTATASAELKATSGEIGFDRLKSEWIVLKTTSGDITGSIVGPMLCYYPEVTSGDVRIPQMTFGESGACSIKTTSGDVYITETNE